MEISHTWLVQDFVAGQNGLGFKNRDIFQGVGVPPNGAAGILKMMECVQLVHKADRRLNGNDRNIYVRLYSKQVCQGCAFERSGGSGCVIIRSDLKKLLNKKLQDIKSQEQ